MQDENLLAMIRSPSTLCALTMLLSPLACDPDDELEVDAEFDAAAPEVDESDGPGAPPDGAVDERTSVTRGSKFVIQGWSHTWHSGNPKMDIGSADDRVCWLIELSGDFESQYESVGVWADNGRWFLSGGSHHGGVMATAHCIPRNYWGQSLSFERSSTYSAWPAMDLGPADGRICFLSSVWGRFKGAGEVVQTYIADGRWWLHTASQQPNLETVGGGAVCLNTGWRIGPFHWTQGQSATLMASAAEWVCGLSRMTGRFEGYGEKVRTPVLGDGKWYMTGASQQSGVSGSAYCI